MSDASTDASTPPDDTSPPADRRTSMRTMKFTPGADTDGQWHESYDWRVGDACAALWSGDGMFYPAVIVAVNRLSRRRVDYVVEYKDGVAEKLAAEFLAHPSEVDAADGPRPVPSQTPRRRRKKKLVRFEDDGAAPIPEEGPARAVGGDDSAERDVLRGDAAGAPKLETVAAEVAEVVAKARRGGERARRLSAGEAASSDDEWSAEAPDAAWRAQVERVRAQTPPADATGGDDAAGDGDATPPLIDATLRLAGIDDDDGDGSAPPPPPGLPLCRDVVNQLPKTPCMTKVANACKRIPRGSPSAPEASEADGSPTKKRLCRADEDFIESHQEIRDAAKRACKECDANKSFFEDTLFAP